MFASGSKTKNVAAKPTSVGIASAAAKSTAQSGRNGRAMRRSASMNVTANVGSENGNGVGLSQTPQVRSKFTQRKITPVVVNNGTPRGRNVRLDNNQATTTNSANGGGGSGGGVGSGGAGGASVVDGGGSGAVTPSGGGNANSAANSATLNKSPNEARKMVRGPPNNLAARALTRQWRSKERAKHANENGKGCADKADLTQFSESGIQTNEQEILNHELIIGDIKLLMPSPALINEIERQRLEARKKTLLNAQRKFEEHSEKQEEHLTDLKEFLEKAVISRRTRKSKITLEVDKKLIHSMDEILNKEVPKSESITDIKERIKKKEQELLTLFDTVENLQI